MSVSRHPVALSIERQVGKSTRLLATVMALPLIDGIFPALVLAGALTYPFGILETGLLVFGGSATVAVILAEMDDSPREIVPSILLLGAIIVPVAAMEAALAPTIESTLDMGTFRRFAGLVIVAVAAKTASARVGEYLPRPAVIIGLGLVASFQPAGLDIAVTTDPVLVAKAAATAGVGVAFALGVALAGPQLRGAVDIDRFRFGSSVALGMLALSVLELMPTDAPVALGVLVVTAVFSFDPDGSSVRAIVEERIEDAVDDEADDVRVGVESDPDAPVVGDGGDDPARGSDGDAYRYPRSEDSRLPWL
jgi:hypothetical protein